MTRRRPQVPSTLPTAPHRPVADEGGGGAWYVALISVVLLIALGIYTAYLYQQVDDWRRAAEQLKTGQEMLRFDRDEILQKVRDREVTLSTLEAAREQDIRRLEVLEDQRQRLQSDVVRLTEELARKEQQADGVGEVSEQSAERDRLERSRDRLERELASTRADMSRLETALAEKDRTLTDQAESLWENEAAIEALRVAKADIETAKASLEQEGERLEREMAERQEKQRKRQIIRGHRASLGEVKPYIAEVGPEDWGVIEGWLAQQLRRPMAVPDLSAHGWSYEGARLLGTSDGPPMAMLLYADAEERPASLTIARDRGGERLLAIERDGGLNLLDWREELHAFLLAGEADEEVLKDVAVDLQNQPPRLHEDAPVPVSRYIRPSLRPEARP